jgi:hypothetical protein
VKGLSLVASGTITPTAMMVVVVVVVVVVVAVTVSSTHTSSGTGSPKSLIADNDQGVVEPEFLTSCPNST